MTLFWAFEGHWFIIWVSNQKGHFMKEVYIKYFLKPGAKIEIIAKLVMMEIYKTASVTASKKEIVCINCLV